MDKLHHCRIFRMRQHLIHQLIFRNSRSKRHSFDRFLQLIIEGGHSSFEFNQNAYSIKNPQEQGVPLALAISQKVLNGRGAWRLQGGGFAGTVQAFVPLEKLDAFKAEMEAILGAGKCHILSIRPEGGAVL